MPTTVKNYPLRFEETELRFSESYPTGLKDVMPIVEFDSIIRRINEDMTIDIKEAERIVRKWGILSIGLIAIVVGLFLTPVFWVKTNKQKKELKKFWERLRIYFGEINRKTFLKRNLEWKLVEDKRKLKGRDVINPQYAYRIEIVHRIISSKARDRDKGEGESSLLIGSTLASTDAVYTHSMSTTSRSTRKNENGAEMEEIPVGSVDDLGQLEIPSRSHDEFELIEEEDEDLVGIDGGDEEDVGNLASISSIGAGSYSRSSLMTGGPMAAAIAASFQQFQEQQQQEEEKGRIVISSSLDEEEKTSEEHNTLAETNTSILEEEQNSIDEERESDDNLVPYTFYQPRRDSMVRFSKLLELPEESESIEEGSVESPIILEDTTISSAEEYKSMEEEEEEEDDDKVIPEESKPSSELSEIMEEKSLPPLPNSSDGHQSEEEKTKESIGEVEKSEDEFRSLVRGLKGRAQRTRTWYIARKTTETPSSTVASSDEEE